MFVRSRAIAGTACAECGRIFDPGVVVLTEVDAGTSMCIACPPPAVPVRAPARDGLVVARRRPPRPEGGRRHGPRSAGLEETVRG